MTTNSGIGSSPSKFLQQRVNAPIGREARDTVIHGTIVIGGINVATSILVYGIVPLQQSVCISQRAKSSSQWGGALLPRRERSGGKCQWCHAPIGQRAKSAINACRVIANRSLIDDDRASALGISIPRGAKMSSQSQRGLDPIGQAAKVVNITALPPSAERQLAGDNVSPLSSTSKKLSKSGNAIKAPT
jgi:hypothetical protein